MRGAKSRARWRSSGEVVPTASVRGVRAVQMNMGPIIFRFAERRTDRLSDGRNYSRAGPGRRRARLRGACHFDVRAVEHGTPLAKEGGACLMMNGVRQACGLAT